MVRLAARHDGRKRRQRVVPAPAECESSRCVGLLLLGEYGMGRWIRRIRGVARDQGRREPVRGWVLLGIVIPLLIAVRGVLREEGWTRVQLLLQVLLLLGTVVRVQAGDGAVV